MKYADCRTVRTLLLSAIHYIHASPLEDEAHVLGIVSVCILVEGIELSNSLMRRFLQTRKSSEDLRLFDVCLKRIPAHYMNIVVGTLRWCVEQRNHVTLGSLTAILSDFTTYQVEY